MNMKNNCGECGQPMPEHNFGMGFTRLQTECLQCRLILAVETVAEEMRRLREGY